MKFKTQILNNQSIITNNQIESLIRVLGNSYRPSKIVVYETRRDMFSFYLSSLNFSPEAFLGKLEGCYDQATDTVYLYIFAQNDDGDNLHSKQLYSLHALVHELRHRYQYVNQYLVDDDHAAEVDADRFATKFINTRSRKISKIMKWRDEWSVEEVE